MQVLALYAGRTALMIKVSTMTVHTAINLMHMAEVQVKCTSAHTAKNGALYGTLSATKASIMSAAASAHQTAHLA